MTKTIDVRDIRFSIVRSVNDAHRATLQDGLVVHRVESVYLPDYGMVKCAPYDNHFCFLDPHKPKGNEKSWFAGCSCGGPAVIVGTSSYAHLGSPQGYLLVCYFHISTGKHADGSS